MKKRYRILLALFLLGSLSLVWLLRSGWLEAEIARRARREVARSLGATLRLGAIRLNLWQGSVVIEQIEIRGKEAPHLAPLFRAKRLELRTGLASLAQNRLDLRALLLDQPQIHIYTDSTGTTNIPGGRGNGSLDSLLDWRLGQFELRDGEFSWNQRQYPFSFLANQLQLDLSYLPASRQYSGRVSAGSLRYQQQSLPLLEAAGGFDFAIHSQGITFERLRLRSGSATSVEARGSLRHLTSPGQPALLELDLNGQIATAQGLPFLPLPIEPRGAIRYAGKLLYQSGRGFELHGDAVGTDLYYRDASTRIGPIRASARLDYLPARLTLSKIDAQALGGALTGIYSWAQSEGWRFDGDLARLQTNNLLRQLQPAKPIPWTALLSGPVVAQGGPKPMVITADLQLKPSSGPSPLEGLLSLRYEEAGNRLLAANSFLALPHSRLNFGGELDRGLSIDFRSTSFAELIPLLDFAGIRVQDLPLQLTQGSMHLAGRLAGSLRSPLFTGQFSGGQLLLDGTQIDQIETRLSLSDQLLSLDQFDLRALGGTLRGAAKLTLEAGKPTSASLLSGQLEAHLPDLSRLPLATPIEGSANLTIGLRGTWVDPSAAGSLRAPELRFRQMRLSQVSTLFTASRRELYIPESSSRLEGAPLDLSLTLRATDPSWQSGSGGILVRTSRLPLQSLPDFQALDLAVNGNLAADAQLDFSWSPQAVTPSRIDGKLTLGGITRFNRPVGQLEFTCRTTGQRAALTATGNIKQLPVKGDAVIQLAPRLDTELRLQIPRLDFPTIAQLFSEETLPSPLPYVGGAEASFYFKGPLRDSSQWDGRLTIPQVQLAPNKDYVRETMPAVADLSLRNEAPIIFEFRHGSIATRDVRLIAKDTNIVTSLRYNTVTKTVDGATRGAINLGLLSTLKPDLIAGGVASIETTLQGPGAAPRLNGRLSFRNASFYLREVITGLDKVNGVVLFDQNRATIETLQAQTGGGNLELSGFIGFGKQISYRLQAQANQVRLRYPEGISTTANASLALTGTTDKSILTGTITILRSTIGRIDTAQLIGGSTAINNPGVPVQNEFLRNLQFDVRLDAAQNVELATAFTKNVKGEIALRLRGTPERPIVLGRLAVTQGEIDFFGSRYQISRGEVNFSNPLRIEPVVGLDLETRVRGVAITMTFSGPASKLSMNYRSDPPLQANEILALLAVGRSPDSVSSIAQTGPMGQTQGMFGNDSSMVVGAAVSAGINGRLQRFFGISRVRLDPQLTGIDNVPQARLTLEQQVSRDVTLTYITNLNRTQQQIVRLDWDISRTWSIVAVRDENGIFGLDLFFRKRVK